MGASPAIQIENVSKTYVESWIRRKRRLALDGLSLEVQRGEIFGLLGGNGAGKTTCIKILLGIIRRSSGKASVLGFPAGDLRARQRIGYLPENLRVPRHLTANTALEYYGALSGLSAAEVRRRRGPLLEKVGIASRANDSVRAYSKGMLQRLGLAQAMLHDPDLFILDEPTDGLDPLARAQVRGFLSELKQQGKTIFLNSHILQEVELICDRVAILDRGVLRRIGNVSELTSGRAQDAGAPLAEEMEVHLDLLGSEASIRAALATVEGAALNPFGEGFRAVARFRDQAAVDALVDRLRHNGASIAALSRRRVSLEQAYLEIVAEPVLE